MQVNRVLSSGGASVRWTVKKSVAAEHPVVTLRYSYFSASIMHDGISVPKCPRRFARESTSSATSAAWRTSSAFLKLDLATSTRQYAAAA